MNAKRHHRPFGNHTSCDKHNHQGQGQHGWDVHPQPGAVSEVEGSVRGGPVRGSAPPESLVEQMHEVNGYEGPERGGGEDLVGALGEQHDSRLANGLALSYSAQAADGR